MITIKGKTIAVGTQPHSEMKPVGMRETYTMLQISSLTHFICEFSASAVLGRERPEVILPREAPNHGDFRTRSSIQYMASETHANRDVAGCTIAQHTETSTLSAEPIEPIVRGKCGKRAQLLFAASRIAGRKCKGKRVEASSVSRIWSALLSNKFLTVSCEPESCTLVFCANIGEAWKYAASGRVQNKTSSEARVGL